ncbi:hypothetical protein F511_16849 [Dorcoceras hygrometricum]|uniref:Uncharacterized protein n=1 Tax=Dorcoceras hygrometricum TaxID=472368 RepID=A0A2Z7CKE2_9LAMI|nr:hypothetical protein F511_16849 [Dorcoceras hygrometricum]
MKRRRAGESADDLALMTSSVTSSQSADGLKEQSQESAGSLYIQTQKEATQSSRKLLFTSRCYSEIAIAKRCRLHKLIRQRFALELKIQQEDFALITSRKIQSRKLCISSRKLYVSSRKLKHRDARKEEVAKRGNRRKISSHSDEPAAKQLTIYEEFRTNIQGREFVYGSSDIKSYISPSSLFRKVPLEEFDAHSFCLHPVIEPRSTVNS